MTYRNHAVRAKLALVRTVLWTGSSVERNNIWPGRSGPTVLVVEEASVSRTLAAVVQRAFPISVLIAGSTSTWRRASESRPIDIAVVDLDLPDGSGLAVVRDSLQCSPSTRCVVAANHDDDDQIAVALAAGALGYLLKNQTESVLVQQLQLFAKGILPFAPSVAQRLTRHFTAERVTAFRRMSACADDDLAPLSSREREVLCLIAKGMQISEVASLLSISENTVCSHVKSIYRKRHVSSRAEAALEAQRLGLV